jgi:hypothetical protein
MLRNLALVISLAGALAGCKSDPYCLNCGNTKGTTSGGGDLSNVGDLSTGGPDLTGTGSDGGCVVTNNGVEVCDGIDNDCNGLVDDVSASTLMNDPNNCGMCGKACDYSGLHEFGQCKAGVCSPAGCTPGYVDADGNPANGCELLCTPTVPPTEVCDGLDNDCNGVIDDGFTKTWQASGKPNYDSDINNCGGCGFVCSLPGAVNVCGTNASGVGVCQVQQCINNPGMDTYRHNPNNGDINVTGCEYHCPTASSTAGDCQPSPGPCTFPAETCNGKDDDCDFVVDDHLTDPTLNTPCGSLCPGGIAANCVGACKAGTVSCLGGALQCVGSVGPTTEMCDGIDNNCDGQVDEPFTSPAPAGYLGGDPTKPLYNSDPSNCGGCTKAGTYNGVCQLQHATNGCHSASLNAQGNCFVANCASGFNYVTHTDSNKSNPTCDVTTPQPRDSVAGDVTTGVGCFYSCAAGFSPPLTNCSGCSRAPSESICDGKDNNCDGCIDNGITGPSGICSTTGLCGTPPSPIPIVCKGPSGWKCNYAADPALDVDVNGNLAPTESKCDGWDNNCNGFCDENFPSVATDPSTTRCAKNAGRQAAACSAGQGVCAKPGVFCCGGTAPNCTDAPTGPFGNAATGSSVVCNVLADFSKASDEICDGKDNNCNGAIDDFAPSSPAPGISLKGYHDQVTTINVPAGDPSLLGKSAAHVVYVYEYEAARQDSTVSSAGGLTARSCNKLNVVPWGGATQVQAVAACAGAGGRLCTAFEWQRACEGPNPTPSPAPTPTPLWGMTNGSVYTQNVCNTGDRTGGPALWNTGTQGTVIGKSCSTVWPGSPQPSPVADMTGNLFEWTLTPVTFQSLTGSTAVAGTKGSVSSTTAGQMQLHFTAIPATGGFLDVNAQPGYIVNITGAATSTTNGNFAILSIVDNQTAILTNSVFPSGGSDGNNGSLVWTVVNTYYKLRGGSYTSPFGGTSCEFDFDIAQPTFANIDVGFRCCFDNKPCSTTADCAGIGTTTCQNGLCK